MMRFARARYSGVAIALHWLTVALVFANLTLGLSMVPLPLSPQKLQWYMWHKWIGITVFVVVCLRLAWRAARKPPPHVAMPDCHRRARGRRTGRTRRQERDPLRRKATRGQRRRALPQVESERRVPADGSREVEGRIRYRPREHRPCERGLGAGNSRRAVVRHGKVP